MLRHDDVRLQTQRKKYFKFILTWLKQWLYSVSTKEVNKMTQSDKKIVITLLKVIDYLLENYPEIVDEIIEILLNNM